MFYHSTNCKHCDLSLNASVFRNFRHTLPSQPVVTITDEGVSCASPDSNVQFIRWENLCAVIIKITDGGPWVEDWYWILFGKPKENVCVI